MISPELLRRYPFFAGLNEAQLTSLAMIANDVSYGAEKILFEECQDADWLIVLTSGSVELTYKSEEPYHPKQSKIFQVGEINPGEIFGVSSLIDPYKYNATATTVKPCHVIQFDAKALRALLDHDCSLGYALMKQIAKAIMERLASTRVQLAAAQT